MANVEGFSSVIAAIRQRIAAAQAEANVSVVVGFTAVYALYVHENVEARNIGLSVPRKSGIGVYWGPHGGPKFLEGPAREMSEELGETVRTAMANGLPMAQALLLAGYKLQREAMERVPVEHDLLRSSAFTKLETELALSTARQATGQTGGQPAGQPSEQTA